MHTNFSQKILGGMAAALSKVSGGPGEHSQHPYPSEMGGKTGAGSVGDGLAAAGRIAVGVAESPGGKDAKAQLSRAFKGVDTQLRRAGNALEAGVKSFKGQERADVEDDDDVKAARSLVAAMEEQMDGAREAMRAGKPRLAGERLRDVAFGRGAELERLLTAAQATFRATEQAREDD